MSENCGQPKGATKMHPEVENFIVETLGHLPDMGNPARVLDCGSLDINGSNKKYFPLSEYVGVDLGAGPNVDLISPVHRLNGVGPFDVVISTEMLEHDRYWKQSVVKMVELVKPGGLMILTCATEGRGEHGTTRTTPKDAPFTNDYYGNVPEAQFRTLVEGRFSASNLRTKGTDLQFWGVKDVDLPVV